MTKLILTLGIEDGVQGAETHPARSSCELRCVCGSLVARVFDAFVELKCRRCKRTMRIPVQRGP